MIELDSEIQTKYTKLRNYLRKNKVVEAKLRLENGTIITYTMPSKWHKTLIDVLADEYKKPHYRSKKKHKTKEASG